MATDSNIHIDFRPHNLKINLEDSECADEYLGYLNLALMITPLTESERDEVSPSNARGVMQDGEEFSS